MEKKSIALIILIILLLVAIAILIFGYFQGTALMSRINQLERDRVQISNDKENVMAQLEQCRNQSQTDHEKLNMIMQDWSNIQKSCITDNVCRGKFPFMRYKCNAQGDAVDNGDKTCECDTNCNLKVS